MKDGSNSFAFLRGEKGISQLGILPFLIVMIGISITFVFKSLREGKDVMEAIGGAVSMTLISFGSAYLIIFLFFMSVLVGFHLYEKKTLKGFFRTSEKDRDGRL